MIRAFARFFTRKSARRTADIGLLALRIEARLLARKQGRAERQAAARAREAAKVRVRFERDRLRNEMVPL